MHISSPLIIGLLSFAGEGARLKTTSSAKVDEADLIMFDSQVTHKIRETRCNRRTCQYYDLDERGSKYGNSLRYAHHAPDLGIH